MRSKANRMNMAGSGAKNMVQFNIIQTDTIKKEQKYMDTNNTEIF